MKNIWVGKKKKKKKKEKLTNGQREMDENKKYINTFDEEFACFFVNVTMLIH